MIIAVVGIVHTFDLLPYYLDHYRRLGVERFVIASDPQELDETGALAFFLNNQRDVESVRLPQTFVRSRLVGMVEEELRLRFAGPRDWVIPADLDELNEYPGDLSDLIVDMERLGCTHIGGQLLDHLAPGGRLLPLRPFEDGVPIWEQYPLQASVTADLGRGSIKKILLSRGDLGWSLGHHGLRQAPGHKAFPSSGSAHHFKWRACLPAVLDWRVENETRARAPWRDESVRIGEHLRTHGRVNLTEIGAQPA